MITSYSPWDRNSRYSLQAVCGTLLYKLSAHTLICTLSNMTYCFFITGEGGDEIIVTSTPRPTSARPNSARPNSARPGSGLKHSSTAPGELSQTSTKLPGSVHVPEEAGDDWSLWVTGILIYIHVDNLRPQIPVSISVIWL